MSNVSIQQVIDNLTTMDINSVPPWAILLIDSMKVVLSQLSNLNGIMEKINALESEVTISKNVSSNLANDNERLRNDLSVLQLKVDDIEQRNRNMCLLIHGVEETDGENTDDLKYVSNRCAGIFVFVIKTLYFMEFPSFFARW